MGYRHPLLKLVRDSCIWDDSCVDFQAHCPKKVALSVKVTQTIHHLFDFLKERANLLWLILMIICVNKKKELLFCEDLKDLKSPC